MKTWMIALIMLMLALPGTGHARSMETGPGNGTDYVKVLFADAQAEINRLLAPVSDQNVGALEVSQEMVSYLTAKTDGVSKLAQIKNYLADIELFFQDGPCGDEREKTASICFFVDPEKGPAVMISVSENTQTTLEQAMAMMIHEAGHHAGDPKHLFLDKLGIQLVNSLRIPTALSSESQTIDLVANVFQAKDGCDKGNSQQAENLKQAALADLLMQCSNRRLTCNKEKVLYAFRGEIQRRGGVMIDMTVKCSVKAVMSLR